MLKLDEAPKQSGYENQTRCWRSRIGIAILLPVVQLALRTPLWLVAFVYVPLAVYLIDMSGDMLLVSPIGLIMFTVVEYVIHRWIFHKFEVTNPALHDRLHGAHHRRPNDSKRRSVPLLYSLVVATPITGLSAFGYFTSAIAAGFIAAYIIFEVVHAIAHARWAKHSKIPLIRMLVHHHAFHHHKDVKKAYGIMIPLWDVVFHSAA